MAKALLYRLFKIGRIPEPLMLQLRAEGLVLWDEGLKGSVTYLGFRAPGRRSNWRRQWLVVSIALTKSRLLAQGNGNTLIYVPLADERFHALRYKLEEPETLCITFDASLFHADWSGTIQCRFRTPQAQAFLDILQK